MSKPLNKDDVKFKPSGVISTSGVLSTTEESELLPELTKDSHGSSSHLIISKEDAQAILLLLLAAFFPHSQAPTPSKKLPNYLVEFTRDSEISNYPGALEAARNQIRKQAHLELEKGVHPNKLSACILTVLQVDNFASKEALATSRSSKSGFPSRIEFRLIRTVARPQFKGKSSGEGSLGTLEVATSNISKLTYVLTYLAATNTFKLLYSSSLCSVTDSVASKYLEVTNQRAMLDLLSRMFTLPLLELNRIAKKKTRERVDNSILKEFEYILNEPMIVEPTSGNIPFASFGWKAIAKDPGLETEEKRSVLSRIRIANLILYTRLHMVLQRMAVHENEETDYIRSLLSCIRQVFSEELTLPGGKLQTNSRQTRLKEKDLLDSATSRRSDDAETMAANFRLGKVRLEIFNSGSDHRRKLYELEFSGFDSTFIENELRVSKDKNLHANNTFVNDEEEASEKTLHRHLDLSSDLGVQLHITSNALSTTLDQDTSGLNARVVPRGTALELLNFVEVNGGMHNAFLEDFNRAWERSRLGYWLRPRNWTFAVSGEDSFVKACRRMHDRVDLLPSYVNHDSAMLEHVIDRARELYSTPRSELPDQEEELRKLQSLFPLKEILRSPYRKKKSSALENPHYLAILCLAYMNVKRELTIQDVLKEAPFIPEALKEKYALSQWNAGGKGYQKRDPFVRMISVLSMNLLGFDPRWSVGLHENIFRRFHSSFFYAPNGGMSLPVMLDAWNTKAPALLPQFASGFRELSSTRVRAKQRA